MSNAQNASPAPSNPKSCPDRPRSGHRILVVDDDSFVLKCSRSLLAQSGYGVDTAENGAEAWQALNAASYDLLITDNDMPMVTGLELLAKVYDARMPLPVIMVTGAAPEAELQRTPWLKPQATLLKPFSREALLGTVERLLSKCSSGSDGSDPFAKQSIPCAMGIKIDFHVDSLKTLAIQHYPYEFKTPHGSLDTTWPRCVELMEMEHPILGFEDQGETRQLS